MRVLIAPWTCAVLVAASCNSADEVAARPPAAFVTMAGTQFNPSEVNVQVGDTVEWRNTTQVPHTVTAESDLPPGAEEFDSGGMATDEVYRRTFTVTGRHPYVCTVHPGMSGVVNVTPATGT